MKEILLLDQDGVLADYDKGFLAKWREIHPNKTVIPPEKRRTFYIEEDYPKELGALVREIIVSKGFYRDLPVMEGAIEAINELKKYFDVLICTAPHLKSKYCISEKFEWIAEHFGSELVRKIVLTKEKTLVRGKYLVDDRPEIKSPYIPEWEHIFYDQPYNRDIDKRRIRWTDDSWRNVLLK